MGSENGSYVLCPRDHRVIRLTIELLEKALNAPFMTAARMVSVGKVLHVLRRLPLPSEDMCVRLDITGPTRTFQDRRIQHSWSVDLDNGCITISSGGYFFRPSSGGDSFSCMSWTAWPGVEAEHADYWAGLRIVDDAQPFEEEVTALNLGEPGYGLIVNDDENPLLDEDADEEKDWDDGHEWLESEDLDEEQWTEESHRAERSPTGGGPSLEEECMSRAPSIVQLAKVASVGLMDLLRDILPPTDHIDLRGWYFYLTLACTYAAVEQLSALDIDPDVRNRAIMAVEDGLRQMGEQTPIMVLDCKKACDAVIEKLVASGRSDGNIFPEALGRWVLANTPGVPEDWKRNSNTAVRVGALAFQATSGWWMD